MRGNITRRGKSSWRLKFDDPMGGERRTRHVTVKGTRRDAERELVRLLNEANRGTLVRPSDLTIGEHVRARIAHWQTSDKISPKTAERYYELLEKAKALDEAVRHDLVIRNVATLEPAPKVSTDEIEILASDQIQHLIGRAVYAPAITYSLACAEVSC